jgi:predicted nucleic acid-binding protein
MPRIKALLDTNIIVDVSRSNAIAVNWLQSQTQTGIIFGIPVLVYMEMIEGVQDAADQRKAEKVLRPFPVVLITRTDSKWAQEQHAKFKLSHNIGIGDALIAAPAARLKVPIYTLNTKHFSPLPDVTAIRPY